MLTDEARMAVVTESQSQGRHGIFMDQTGVLTGFTTD